jgi:phage nucleotide-binding protein
MAIDLNTLSKPTGQRPIIATVFGEGGMGKTTLAAMFPKPVFIRTEDGTASLAGNEDVALFPIATSSQDVLDAIEALARQDHGYKTVVLDSITQLATMIDHEIVEADPKAKSIAHANGGYGAGYGASAERHRMVREWAGSLAYDRGMNVIFIAHSDTETLELPDMDAYARYTIRMHKKSLPHYTDNVDLVAQIRLKTFVRGDGERKRAISTGDREIICFPQASSTTKNRFNITGPLDFSFTAGNPFEQFAAK